MTAVCHAGYSDFRSEKMRKPITGDVIWSVPTLVTLNPIGAPIAHAGLHTSAVLHGYDTDTFLPPHCPVRRSTSVIRRDSPSSPRPGGPKAAGKEDIRDRAA